ncbi:hypothetical protein GFL85_32005 [Rhizobium laguerreae]|nr:hypothetical protein [Rhizobium laguerreae]
MVVSNPSANFRSAEPAKLSTKRVSAPDPEHPFQTLCRQSPLTSAAMVMCRRVVHVMVLP